METRLGQWNAHHLERPRIAALQLRQIEPPGSRIGLQQRQRACLHPAVDLRAVGAATAIHVRDGGRPLVLGQSRVARADLVFVKPAQLRVPGQDVGIGLQAAHAHRSLAGGRAQIALHMTQRERQQRRRGRRARRVNVALDDAKWRCRELGNRRRVAGGHPHRKGLGVGQRPPGIVLQARRQGERVDRVFSHAHGQRDGIDLGRLVGRIVQRRDGFAVGAHQANLLGELALDRR